MADGRAPDGVPAAERPGDGRRRPPVPQSFQTRLTFAFIAVVALTLTLIAPVLVVRLDDFVRQQEETRLQERADGTALVLVRAIADVIGDDDADRVGRPERQACRGSTRRCRRCSSRTGLLEFAADEVALADVVVRFGPATPDTDGKLVPDPDPMLEFQADTTVERGGRPGARPGDPAGHGDGRPDELAPGLGRSRPRCESRGPAARRCSRRSTGCCW